MTISDARLVISGFESRQIPAYTPRSLPLTLAPHVATAVAGPRRCGKTFRTLQLVDELTKEGWPREAVCRVQFNDLRLREWDASALRLIDEAYYGLHPTLRNRSEVCFIFDEIQRIDGWEQYVLQLLDDPRHRVVVTGSTSHLLSGSIASALRGKCVTSRLLCYSFAEFLRHLGIADDTVSPEGRGMVRKALDRYLQQGGYPGLFAFPPEQHVDILQGYWSTMLIRDVVEAHRTRRTDYDLLGYFAQALLSRTGRPLSMRKLLEEMRSHGYTVSTPVAYEYARYLEEAFAVFLVPIFSESQNVRRRNYVKPYAVDWGLASAVAFAGAVDASRLFENLVFVDLLRRGHKVFYYRTRKDYEIDFITIAPDKRTRLFQVCLSLNAENRLRELRGIPETVRHFGLDSATIVTMDEEGEEVADGVRVNVVPAWKWLLE